MTASAYKLECTLSQAVYWTDERDSPSERPLRLIRTAAIEAGVCRLRARSTHSTDLPVAAKLRHSEFGRRIHKIRSFDSALSTVVGECLGDARRECFGWHRIVHVKHDGAVALEGKIGGVQRPESFNQARLAVEIDGVLLWLRFFPGNSDGAADSGELGQVRSFSPLEGFHNAANPVNGCRCLKYQRTESQHLAPNGRRIAVDDLRYCGINYPAHGR